MQFTNPTAGGRIQAQAEPWDGTSVRVTRDCAGHRATNQGCALDLGDGRCDRPVLAVQAGTVTYRDTVQGIIRIDHGGGWQSDYAHMNPLLVTVGTKVSQGQQIGEIGDAHDPAVLNFSGCHLHYGLLLNGMEQDPWPYLNATIGGDVKITIREWAAPRQCGIAAGATVDGWNETTRLLRQTFPISSSFMADAEVTIEQPIPPSGLFYRAKDGVYAGMYVPSPHVTLAPAPPTGGGITPAQLAAAVKAATDPLTAQLAALNAKIANAKTALN